MEETYYEGLCGAQIRETWEEGIMNVTCQRGYGMQCQGEKQALEICNTCRFCFDKVREENQ